jgi:hypothetical protein
MFTGLKAFFAALARLTASIKREGKRLAVL